MFAAPFKPYRMRLFAASGLKPKPDLLISRRETSTPESLISPIAFATFE